jgi:hypothetical protein
MSTIFKRNGQQLIEGRDVVAGDVVIPWANLAVWSEGDFAAHGITRETVEDPPAPPPAPPEMISDRQFAHGLAKHDIITQAEALAFVKTGEIPAALGTIVSNLPESQRFDAEMMLSGSVEFHLHHPFTIEIAEAYGWTPEETAAFWTYCASL